jgi:uncharacterized membrane protein
MSNLSKEELRKKLAQRKNDRYKNKSSKLKKGQKIFEDQDSNISTDLKKLGLVTLIVLIIFIAIIILKEKTGLFNQLSNLFYGLIK